jgi:uncharacterized protein (TIGR03083 family)
MLSDAPLSSRSVTEPLIESLATVWASIASACDGLPETAWNTPTECPGWTVKDNVAHMIGTERMLLGEQPEASSSEASHIRNDIGRVNEQWVAMCRAQPGSDVLAAFTDVTNRRLEALRAMTTDEWDKEGFTPEGPGPYRQFMAIRVFDCWFHEQDIREALGAEGDLDGPVAVLSIGRIARGLPYVVGKKAGAPQGTTVVFDVTGATPTVVPIAVEGRAAVLERAPADPTVRLTMDSRTYARLAGGRWPGQRVLDDNLVTIAGDRDLGERIVRDMAFTI